MIIKYGIYILFSAAATLPLHCAVNFTALTDIFIGGATSAERLDLNSDGVWDIEFFGNGGSSLKLATNAGTEVLATPIPPLNLGGDVQPFDVGAIIGPDSANGEIVWFSQEATFYQFELVGNSVLSSGVWGNNAANLGFRIEEKPNEFHYGYINVDTLNALGAIQGFGYETAPNTSIVISSIPEPSMFLLCFGVGFATFLVRKTRGK